MKRKSNSFFGKCALLMLALCLLLCLVACDSLQGAQGEKGEQGAQGIQGERGEKGEQGEQGAPGTTLAIGANGNWILDGADTGVSARGQNGTSISIGANGNWFLDGEDTGFSSRGQNGTSISIGENGNWFLDGVDSGVRAQGPSGSTIGIGENGNWFVDGEDTGHSSIGLAGAPGSVVTVGENDNWFIDGEDTGISCVGEKGDRGTVVEIGANGNWFLDGVDSGVPASGAGAASASLAEATAKLKRSTVTVSVRTEDGKNGIGSGFVYDDKGHICTNHHVIDGAVFVQVILHDGTAREAEIVGYNVEADVAVLKVDPEGLEPATLANSDLLSTGDRVFAVGTPTALSYIATATYGHVSEPHRLLLEKDTYGSILKKMKLIQTDTPINPGNSGGPLADAYGRVVGVVTMKLLTTQNDVDVEGMGFALPINGVKIIADDIIENGALTVKNPITKGKTVVGISSHGGEAGYWYYVDPLTNQVKQSETGKAGYHYMAKTGIYVSDASSANVLDKLQAGDIVMKINGYSLARINELNDFVNLYEEGDTVTLTVWRGDAEIEVEVSLIEEELA